MVLSGTVLHGFGRDSSIPDPAWRTLKVGFLDPGRAAAPIAKLLRRGNRDNHRTFANDPGVTTSGMIRQLKRNLLPLNFARMPDRRITWLVPALTAVFQSGVRPDAIFTSSSPPTCAIIGAILKGLWGVPWIAEFRDLWSHNNVEVLWPVLSAIDERLERVVVSGADCLATVSDELADDLSDLHGKNVMVLENGHDWHEPPVRRTHSNSKGPVRLLHGGSLYGGRRNPRVLIEALKGAVEHGMDVRAIFIGKDAKEIAGNMSVNIGISDRVKCLDAVPHGEYTEMMADADAMVVIEDTNPRAAGNATGKLFEYVGTRKPVLAIAPPGGAIDRTLRRTGQGKAVTTTEEMIRQIERLGSMSGFSVIEKEVRALSRKSIAGKLAGAFDDLVSGHGGRHE